MGKQDQYKLRIKDAIKRHLNRKDKNKMSRQAQSRTETRRTKAPVANQNSNAPMNASSPIEYMVDGEKRTFWQNLGKAFKTQKGIMVKLNALPTNGTIFLSYPEVEDTSQEEIPF